jgi:recombination protein RecA
VAFGKKSEKQTEIKIVVPKPTSDVERFKTLFALGKKLNTKYETTNALVKLGDKVGTKLPSISTGLPTFDYGVVGTGGIPKGRVIEIFGPESSGKTSFTLHVIAECQKAGGIAAFIDAEHSLDPSWAALLGVDVEKLVVSQPDSGEQALDTVDELVESQSVDLIVVDSVSALVPEAELAGEIGDCHVGLQARLLSQALRILTAKCAKNNTTVIFINQLRYKIGTMYGNPETTSGGNALKFYASVRIDVRRREEIKQGTELQGHQIRIKGVKCKVGIPFKETVVELNYETGFDKVGDLITYADTLGVFEKAGSWFKLDGANVANGLPAMKALLKGDSKELEKVRIAMEKKIAEGTGKALV